MEVCKIRVYIENQYSGLTLHVIAINIWELKLFKICHKKPFGNQLLYNVYEKNAQLIHLRDKGSIIIFIFIIHFYSIMYILP